MQEDTKYTGAVMTLGERMRRILLRVPIALWPEVTEIRLRAGKPLVLMLAERVRFVKEDGKVSDTLDSNPFIMTRTDLQESFISLCGWAVHSHQKELTDGYIAVRGGHRAGVAATAVSENGSVTAVRDIASINLRVAREIFGAADPLIQDCFRDRLCGLLLIGAPASGKTTLLRDLARQLSSGATGTYIKVCVVDESGEIGAALGGVAQSELGPCCDLLSGYPKERGLQVAIRYLSPQIIICDEVSTDREIDAITSAANSGVSVVTSIHAASFEEFSRKSQAGRLLRTGAFEQLALLAGADNPSKIRAIKEARELWLPQ